MDNRVKQVEGVCQEGGSLERADGIQVNLRLAAQGMTVAQRVVAFDV
jgi:hypothetical protein